MKMIFQDGGFMSSPTFSQGYLNGFKKEDTVEAFDYIKRAQAKHTLKNSYSKLSRFSRLMNMLFEGFMVILDLRRKLKEMKKRRPAA